MANLTLQVIVSGGSSAFGITYELYSGNHLLTAETKRKSFVKSFNNLSGRYQLYIYGSGPNSDDKKVEIEVSGDNINILSGSSVNPLIVTDYEVSGHYYLKTS
ncbi:hypothetical protein [Chryseobacterium gwangjuense]|uniref:hypothetical protein n=1 Tax=Chryseobacterium gwangjuense TaxID=1069980 RepID=UPI001E571BD7|nr:hypothetical protein [Chryseobacterium gwangjuense]MCE3077062.1 hypothetical protein [Chryseobacterium gwangjuense]